jgi:hypothetical protein
MKDNHVRDFFMEGESNGKTHDAVRHLGDDAVTEIGLSLSLLRGSGFEDGDERVHC